MINLSFQIVENKNKRMKDYLFSLSCFNLEPKFIYIWKLIKKHTGL